VKTDDDDTQPVSDSDSSVTNDSKVASAVDDTARSLGESITLADLLWNDLFLT